jgi:hypothetical protein
MVLLEGTISRRLLDAAPPLTLSESALEQVVGLSSDDEPITLGQYLAVRAPEVAKRFRLSEPAPEQRQSVRAIEDLSDSEVKRVVKLRLRRGADGLKLAVLGQGVLSMEELEKEIDADTELGRRVVEAERSNLALLQRLAETGKLRSTIDTDSPIAVPSLPF